eukprot:13041_1
MGRRKKKKKQNKNKKATNNNQTHSKKLDILNTIQQAQDITSAHLNEAHVQDRSNGNNHRNNHKNRKNNRNKGKNKWKNKGSYNYKSEINQFLDQLRPLGLGIRNARSDGNCLFRAIADQLNGDENNHAQFRKDIIQYMTDNNEEFAPFYVGDYTAYLKKMSRNGIWGGNMELTAAAKTFHVDIVIHALAAARYEILYQKGKPRRTIHLSYHDERHYASVRKIDDMQGNRPAAAISLDKTHVDALQREQQRAEIAWCHSGGNPLDIESAKDELMDLTPSEQMVVAKTGCYDIGKVKKFLKHLDGDIDAAVENIIVDMSLMANQNKEKIMEELKTQQEEEKENKKHNKKHKKKKKKKQKHTHNGVKNEPKPTINETLDEKTNDIVKDVIAAETETIHQHNKDDNVVQNITKIQCISCAFEHEVLMIYLNHYRLVHLKREHKAIEKKEDDTESIIQCMCGHKNQSDFSFCSECGWDLRFKPIIPPDVQEAMEKQKKQIKPKQPVIKAPRIDTDKVCKTHVDKYKKYLNKYWICDQCSFWNCKTSNRCLVCSMLQINAPNVTKIECTSESKMDVKSTANTSNWVSMVIQNKKPKAKPKQPPPQKKKNPFAWICDKCTLENKPAHQKCKTCGNPKPKKSKKKKQNKAMNGWRCSCTLMNDASAKRCAVCHKKRNQSERNGDQVYYADPQHDVDEDELKKEMDSYDKPWEQYNNHKDNKQLHTNGEMEDDDDDDSNKWSIKGKCPCGSGKKYRKCCKKLHKHQDNTSKNKYKNVDQTVTDDIDETMNGNQLDEVIHTLECQISNFKGKTKSQMMRELAKLKAQQRALCRKLESNKNRVMKAQNKRDKNKKNGTMASNNNGVIHAVANTTIAI